MESTQNRSKWLERLPRMIGAFVFLISMLCTLQPDIRQFLRSLFRSDSRQVLSVLENVNIGNRRVDILKIQSSEGLVVEVYDRDSELRPLIGKTILTDRLDAFFMLRGKPSNLFISDIDGDGMHEIIAPTYDRNLVAHLNVLNFRQLSGDRIELVLGP